MVGINDALLYILGKLNIFNDDGAFRLHIKVKESSVVGQQFNVLAEETNVAPGKMVVKFVLGQLFLEFIDPGPGEQAYLKIFRRVFDVILEEDINSLRLALGTCGVDGVGLSHLHSVLNILRISMVSLWNFISINRYIAFKSESPPFLHASPKNLKLA